MTSRTSAAPCVRAVVLAVLCHLLVVGSGEAQTRLAVLQAEDRRAATANDLATLRSAARSGDPQIARIGVRALGRLERPELIADILPLLRSSAPGVRAEAANAVAQAAQPWKNDPPKTASGALDGALGALAARLKAEGDVDARAALAETIGRLPYTTAAQAEKAEQVLVDFAGHAETVTDRLGAAKGLEALVRISRKLRSAGADAVSTLKQLATPASGEANSAARVRRLAVEALLGAGAADDVAAAAAKDPDAQVRRLATRAAPADVVRTAAGDDSPIVRLEAIRQLTARKLPGACDAAVEGAADREPHVALVAIDQLGGCGAVPAAVSVLDRSVTDLSDAGAARAWHRAAHALVALAAASPERAAAVLPQFTQSRTWQLRLYAARAAAALKHRDPLEALAGDADDNVREAAVDGLRRLYGHDADRVYLSQLTRGGYQILRAAAVALAGTPGRAAAVAALKSALDRLTAERKDNSHDARKAIAATLAGLGEPVPPSSTEPFTRPGSISDLNADDLRRLASPRARVTVRGVGAFDLALFTAQAPATVLRFARLAEAGYFNGLTFHRVVPNFVIQGGSPGANEYVGDSPFMRDELGLWPHVRGAVGISTRGRDTGDAQIFVDLVDNPRLDHDYTVFAQVLNGIDVVDRVLEGDVIEGVEIFP